MDWRSLHELFSDLSSSAFRQLAFDPLIPLSVFFAKALTLAPPIEGRIHFFFPTGPIIQENKRLIFYPRFFASLAQILTNDTVIP